LPAQKVDLIPPNKLTFFRIIGSSAFIAESAQKRPFSRFLNFTLNKVRFGQSSSSSGLALVIVIPDLLSLWM
jgi:hypothetical protein